LEKNETESSGKVCYKQKADFEISESAILHQLESEDQKPG
jgi:hypothetical protein